MKDDFRKFVYDCDGLIKTLALESKKKYFKKFLIWIFHAFRNRAYKIIQLLYSKNASNRL